MARVRLHTGNPDRAITPPWGGRDILGSNPEFARGKPRPNANAKCGWCGSESKVDRSSTPAYCTRCRALNQTIQRAKDYLALHALRPLGGSDASDSAEELTHRQAAMRAQTALNSMKKPGKAKPGNSSAKKKSSTKSSVKPGKTKKVKVAESPQARTSRLTAEVTRLTMALADEVASTEPLTPEQQLRIQRLRTQRTNILRGIAQRESQGRK